MVKPPPDDSDALAEVMAEAVSAVERIESADGARPGAVAENRDDLPGEAADVIPTEVEALAPRRPAKPPSGEDPQALKDQLLRLAADFDNFRKRTRRQQEDQLKYGHEKLIRELLPVVDNLQRAMLHVENSNDSLVQGVQMVTQQFVMVLEEFGAKPFVSLGQRFDPAKHEAMSRVVSDDVPAGCIVSELHCGYTYHERLLRAARVVVSMGPPDAPATHAGSGSGAGSDSIGEEG